MLSTLFFCFICKRVTSWTVRDLLNLWFRLCLPGLEGIESPRARHRIETGSPHFFTIGQGLADRHENAVHSIPGCAGLLSPIRPVIRSAMSALFIYSLPALIVPRMLGLTPHSLHSAAQVLTYSLAIASELTAHFADAQFFGIQLMNHQKFSLCHHGFALFGLLQNPKL